MSIRKIAVIVGSLRAASFNRKLADALVRLAPAELVLSRVRIDDLPLYNQDDDDKPAACVARFRKDVRGADGVLFVTPEYNRSIPGVLKNAIDQGSRPYGQSVWTEKPAGIIGISPGRMGTALAQQHLRNVLASLDMPTLALPEVFLQADDRFFDAAGIVPMEMQKLLQGWLNRFEEWVTTNAQ